VKNAKVERYEENLLKAYQTLKFLTEELRVVYGIAPEIDCLIVLPAIKDCAKVEAEIGALLLARGIELGE